jgi:lipopolysaccharide/colanic/teichoic acid biosynthesis glycosyltransferase
MGALILLFPVLLLVGLAIVLEDGGPVLYYQSRVGQNGKLFRFYKFRSMVKNADAIKEQLAALNEADGPIFKMKNDPRITRVGRFLRRSSVDELPQFINVLRGEMSLIGPRPHLPREVDLYAGRQQQRLLVQPGLVCLREVHGRSNLTFDQWVELDLLYIQNRSICTDLSILARLVPAVLKGDGAY